MLFRFFRRPSPRTLRRAYPLAKAAQLSSDMAHREKRALAYLAERENPSNTVFWFAANALRVVPVYGRRDNGAPHEQIAREQLVGLVLTTDMGSLRSSPDAEPSFVDLRMRVRDFRKYLRWIRSVW